MEQYLPIIAERITPIFPEEKFRIHFADEKIMKRYEVACSNCKQFLSGVVLHQGVYYATLCDCHHFSTNASRYYVVATATERVRIKQVQRGKNLFSIDAATFEPYPYSLYLIDPDLQKAVARINELKAQIGEFEEWRDKVRLMPDMSENNVHQWINRSGRLFLEDRPMQELFLVDDVHQRLAVMRLEMERCLDHQELTAEVSERVDDNMRTAQREYYLREQLRVINDELYGADDDITELEEMIAASNAPADVVDKMKSELRKLVNMQPSSPDSFVARNWIETVAAMPWGVTSTDNLSIENAREILENEHYGMDKVKQRILEFLSVHRLVGDKNGNILCLFGPPGVGKTSIAKSIAHALGRQYVRISLGGMHDEAEIRGHRRTYIGSMVGKIISGIKKAGTINPVFLMDEVDKLSNDYKGDPASALLEVLDPEQNKAFLDNYLEVPFDLSKVLFITTANNVGQIAKPLQDRMEMIELTGYTVEEKEQIAYRHLLPKQIQQHGLPDGTISLSAEAMRFLIDGYTKEAGVRGLEQQIAALCRKVAVSFGDANSEPVTLSEADIRRYLGVARYERIGRSRQDAVGIITGLAWTELGGEPLELEAVRMPTAGHLRLTGNLGKVMRESAMTAYGYVRAHCAQYGIEADQFNYELHVHAPEGAVPKDGPSAGCALTCLIVSALSGRKIRADRALTGEVSLTGRVMPIGGLKEKSLAALREGITTVLVPADNRRDVEELPETIKSKITYLYFENVQDVVKEMVL